MRQIATWEIGAGGFKGAIHISEPHDYLLEFVRPRPQTPLVEVVAFFVHPLRRSAGWGSLLMAKACAYADRCGADVGLFVRPYGLRRTKAGAPVPKPNTEKLMEFYSQYGFKPVRVRNLDKITTDITPGTVMVRRVPK